MNRTTKLLKSGRKSITCSALQVQTLHNADHEPTGGIMTEYPIHDNETLIRTLRAGRISACTRKMPSLWFNRVFFKKRLRRVVATALGSAFIADLDV